MEKIEEQLVKVRVINFTEEYFRGIGYNVKNGDYITIQAKELPPSSSVKVWVYCQYCGKRFLREWRRYIHYNIICCKDCSKYRVAEVNLQKYGVACSLLNPDIAMKRQKTWDDKYGVGKSPLCNDEVRKKASQTMISRYGVTHKTINTSKQQLYLCELYCAIPNHHIDKYVVDGLIETNIVFEYDGYGHNLAVRLGEISQDEFSKKEIERENFLLSLGYKIFRISYMNKKDKLPSDKLLLEIKTDAIQYFSNGYNYYNYNLQTNTKSFR